MAVPSIALAYKRSALMTASKVTVKKPDESVIRARDSFQDFCKAMDKPPAKHMLEWHKELCTGEDSECIVVIGGQTRNCRTKHIDPRTPWICQIHCPWYVCSVDDRPTCSCQENAAYSVHCVHGRYLA